jgi:protein SCO1/2
VTGLRPAPAGRPTGRRRWLALALGSIVLLQLVLISGAPAPAALADRGYRGFLLRPPETTRDFALHDQQGKLVRLSGERGRFVLLTFLYTRCPDVCPLIAGNLNVALRELGSSRSRVRVLAVSVDPKGDTPAAVRRFVRNHRLLPEFRYLIGSRGQLAVIWKAYHVAPQRIAGVSVHTAYVLLVDRSGRGQILYDSRVTPGDVVHDLRKLGLR